MAATGLATERPRYRAPGPGRPGWAWAGVGHYRRSRARPRDRPAPSTTAGCRGPRRCCTRSTQAWPASPSTGPSAATPCRGRSCGACAGCSPAPPTTPRCRVVVLAGAGDEAFCAGADLGKMTGADEPEAGIAVGPRGPRRAGRGVRRPVGTGQAHRGAGAGLRPGRGLRAGAGLRPGGGVGAGPLRGSRDQRRPVALHDHRSPGALDASQAGARADAHGADGRRRRGADVWAS